MDAIRRMTSSDLAETVGLFARVYREPPYREKWSRREAALYLGKVFKLDRRGCFVARVGDALAGALMGYTYRYRGSRVFHMHELFVDAKLRRRGVARRLMRRALGEDPKETVFTMFAHREAEAMKFYRRHGFKQHDKYKFYFSRIEPTALGNGESNGDQN